MRQGLKVKGSYRLNIVDDPHGEPKIVGDSGWRKNVVVNLGYNDYICQLIGGMAGSKVVTHVTLGTGTEPPAAGTALDGEIVEASKRASITAATSNTSVKLRCTATFESSDAFVTETVTLKNIALVNTETGGTIMCGNTYATSSCATNQNVNVTYDLDFT